MQSLEAHQPDQSDLRHRGRTSVMKYVTAALAGTPVLFSSAPSAQQGVDFSKVEIKTTDLGNNTYMLEGQGRDIPGPVGTHGIIMLDTQFAPLPHKSHAAGTTNAVTGNKTPPVEPAALPTETYMVGDKKLEVGGRVAVLKHVYTAHTDGDTWVMFPDANVLVTGDVYGSRTYPNLDWGSGGTIDGMILALETFLKAANDTTKIVPGHGPVATKANLQQFHDMMVTARDRVKNLYDAGKTEQDVLAADPLAGLNTKWAAPQGITSGPTFLRNGYNSFRNHN